MFSTCTIGNFIRFSVTYPEPRMWNESLGPPSSHQQAQEDHQASAQRLGTAKLNLPSLSTKIKHRRLQPCDVYYKDQKELPSDSIAVFVQLISQVLSAIPVLFPFDSYPIRKSRNLLPLMIQIQCRISPIHCFQLELLRTVTVEVMVACSNTRSAR